MKTTRKFLTMVLVLTMVLTMATTAFAAAGGTIEITGETDSTNSYAVYKMFDVVDVGSNNYIYKLATGWEDFEAPGYLEIKEKDGVKYATWDGSSTPGTDADAAAIAQYAKQYAQDHSLTAIDTVNVGGQMSVTEDGYYLLLSTTGTSGVVAVEGGETVTVKEKSPSGGGVGGGDDESLPNVTKEVKEDSTGTWVESNDADVGQTIEFQTTIKANTGASNYILHDTMATGMSFIEVTGVTVKGTPLPDSDYSVTAPTDGCAFHVTFNDTVLNGLVDEDEIVVSYTAKLTKDATIDYGIVNNTWLTHTSTHVPTNPDSTSTKTYQLGVSKIGANSNPLPGAEFVLMKGSKYYKYDDANGVAWVDTQGEATTYTSSDPAGTLTFFGIDADTYTLVETKVPGGYKQPTTNPTVTITNISQIETVLNDIDDPLPETGGMGTTLFYTLGGLMVMAAAVLLVTKKRVSV